MMMIKPYTVRKDQKGKIREKITDILKNKQEQVFAYLHGSFLEGNFRDIDLAVYLNKSKDKKEMLEHELSLEREVEEHIGFPVDVRILNHAPLPFRFTVIKEGTLLFSKNENVRSDFESLTFVEHHDFDFYRETYRRDALGIVR